MQRVGTNTVSNIPKLAGETHAHCVIVLDVKKNDKGNVEAIRIGDLRAKPENQRLLTDKRYMYSGGKRIREKYVFGEKIGDYDYFRVTNDPLETREAVEKAEQPEKWDITMDPETAITGLTRKKDVSKPNDKKMICSEYVNFIYKNKFRDPKKGVTLPSHIYKYQKKIKRPK